MDIKDVSQFAPIKPIQNIGQDKDVNRASGFADLVTNATQNVMANQKEAASLSQALAEGQNVPMQDVIAAVGKAELTLQTMVTVRDKAVEAYKEILNMPI